VRNLVISLTALVAVLVMAATSFQHL